MTISYIDRDIIITYNNVDYAIIIVNGFEVSDMMEYSQEIGEAFPEIFKKLEHLNENKPLLYSFWDEEYFSRGEIEVFWNRIDRQYKNDNWDAKVRYFTEEELDVLYNEGFDKFIDKVKENLQLEANQIDKEIQEI